ncbi:hypothetical protein Tsp_05554 [Trichinella spiralis]|uniref:hypothetical protein n=1 Tax=Trichinella spiralis TaxID=6334 RepID=UPI0001EFDDD2|nr:hypothetical protein Tsp_05554 [Trichinella spiralis]
MKSENLFTQTVSVNLPPTHCYLSSCLNRSTATCSSSSSTHACLQYPRNVPSLRVPRGRGRGGSVRAGFSRYQGGYERGYRGRGRGRIIYRPRGRGRGNGYASEERGEQERHLDNVNSDLGEVAVQEDSTLQKSEEKDDSSNNTSKATVVSCETPNGDGETKQSEKAGSNANNAAA